jgi:hypothetical protein
LIVRTVYLEAGLTGLLRLAQLRGSPTEILNALAASIPEFAQPDRWWREAAARAMDEPPRLFP